LVVSAWQQRLSFGSHAACGGRQFSQDEAPASQIWSKRQQPKPQGPPPSGQVCRQVPPHQIIEALAVHRLPPTIGLLAERRRSTRARAERDRRRRIETG
jgi:hypothetical protein